MLVVCTDFQQELWKGTGSDVGHGDISIQEGKNGWSYWLFIGFFGGGFGQWYCCWEVGQSFA